MKKISVLVLALLATSAFADTPEETAAKLLDPAKVADVAKDPKAAVAALLTAAIPTSAFSAAFASSLAASGLGDVAVSCALAA